MTQSARSWRNAWTSLAGLAAALWLLAPLAAAGDLTLSVQQRNDRPLAGAVITLESESPALPAAPPVHAIMDQLELAFVPDVLVIPVNSTVQFPNSDAVSHQVYSFSPARSFQLPLYRGKPYPPVTFDQPGVVTLGCNIHDNMLAYVVVTRAPWFGRTDEHGKWTATNVPAGKFRVRLWHPLLNEGGSVEREVVMSTAAQSVDLRLTRNLRPAPLSGKPHSWDY